MPTELEAIQRLGEILLKCHAAHPPKDPTHVKSILLSLIQQQYPKGTVHPGQQDKLGCCEVGPNKIPNWTEPDCTGIGGTWTYTGGPCPETEPTP